MPRKTLLTLLLLILSALLAVALFIAGAIWRGRVTVGSAAPYSRELLVAEKLAASARNPSEEASRYAWVGWYPSGERRLRSADFFAPLADGRCPAI